MQVYKIIFSPTGGTEKVADILCKEFCTNIKTIDLSEPDFAGYSIEDDGIAVIAMPSYGGRAPKTAVDRLKTIKATGNKAIVVAVYGNREQEDTLIEMTDAAQECGFKIIAGVTAIAEHSIVRQYGAGRPNQKDAKQLQGFANQIKERLTETTTPLIPGNRPYKKAGAGMVPKASSACVSCGLCAGKCPVSAIDKANPKKTDKNICINCMRCVSICPQNARSVRPMMMKLVSMALKKACSEEKENKLYL